jgi:hypothetical protein
MIERKNAGSFRAQQSMKFVAVKKTIEERPQIVGIYLCIDDVAPHRCVLAAEHRRYEGAD